MTWRWGPLAGWLDEEGIAQTFAALRDSPAAPLWVLGAYIVASLTAVPLVLLAVATTLVFGPLAALGAALVGGSTGGVLGFALGRALGRGAVRDLAGARVNELSRRLARRGVLAVITARVLPLAPFMVVNLVIGASHIRWRDFLVGNALGVLPGTLAVALLSDSLVATVREPSAAALASLAAVAAASAVAGVVTRRWLRAADCRPRDA
ncbi:MAG: TVP38/TMEM64 family protein [Burkholderiales bacterium]|nr:TVP38/TMEM64 family protein [Burkholderiales bacterium]